MRFSKIFHDAIENKKDFTDGKTHVNESYKENKTYRVVVAKASGLATTIKESPHNEITNPIPHAAYKSSLFGKIQNEFKSTQPKFKGKVLASRSNKNKKIFTQRLKTSKAFITDESLDLTYWLNSSLIDSSSLSNGLSAIYKTLHLKIYPINESINELNSVIHAEKQSKTLPKTMQSKMNIQSLSLKLFKKDNPKDMEELMKIREAFKKN